MERKESRNGLELIKFAAIRLRGNFSALFMGALAMVTPLVLVLLVPLIISVMTSYNWIISIGIVLFAILCGPLQMGFIKYYNNVINGEQPKLMQVYSCLRFNIFTLKTMYIAMLLLLMYIVGGVLWIVPAGFAVSFYSMSLFFLERNPNSRLSGAMNECFKYMIGNRLAMFSYKLIFYFLYFCLFVIGALCLALIVLLAMDSMFVSYIIAICSTIIFVFLYTMVTVYYHSANQIFFEDTIMYNERRKDKPKTKNIEQNTENIIENETNEKEKMNDEESKITKEIKKPDQSLKTNAKNKKAKKSSEFTKLTKDQTVKEKSKSKKNTSKKSSSKTKK